MNTKLNGSSVKRLLLFFIIGLAVSGATAMPVGQELQFLLRVVPADSIAGAWGCKVLHSYRAVQEHAPFLLYGYDWLAFAQFVLVVLFIGPYKDPVKNSWVIQFGLITCVLVIPFALIAGAVHGIPFWWRLIDCSFGVAGFAVLYPCYRQVKTITTQSNTSTF